MNIHTDTHRNLAEALTPLPAGPASDVHSPEEGQRQRGSSSMLRILLLSGLLAVGGLVYWRADLPDPAALSTWAGRLLDAEASTAGSQANSAAAVSPAPVSTTSTVSPAPLPVFSQPAEITGSGYVTVQDYASVFAKYEGTITQLFVELGDHVQTGQILVEVSDPGAQFALQTALIDRGLAELRFETRRIELEQTSRDFDRINSLLAKETVTERATQDAATALELARTALKQAEQDMRMADLKVQIAQEHVDELIIRAPVSGIVTQLSARVGNSVLARVDTIRDTDNLMVITDTTSVYLDAEVAETNVSRLRVGLSGEAVLDGFPDQPFAVHVTGISPVVSAERGTISLRLALDTPPEGMRPNMAARIRIALGDT
ncbi:efflux RND transporter periplasmic adaptor subunit [Phaeobacter gallaeciensis]|uniref:efflux RND transporter periplasmic adaptor subunit n=1 Tax=Phaeobacter gallaeciensis TaxID=60890 RepID=UPI000BC06980|nr:efflux RND transporter periplasmic adaptor subunit [Phaeobacter gallaeciensis]ATF18589.1 RND family efflux transporter, MFP subunit [Phaeobacter gallaeciensis]ATF22698.1 RND family efflux transporter, MFP subunit [Phaeobacter gallaeciensis]